MTVPVDFKVLREAGELVLERALQEGGLEGWARIDRRIPTTKEWIIVTSDHTSCVINRDVAADGLRRFLDDIPLRELNCHPLTAEWVTDLLEGASSDLELPTWIAGQIIQCGLFGKVFFDEQ